MKKLLILSIVFLMSFYSGKAQWTQMGADIDGEAANDRSGESVCISSDGNTVAIGAIFNDGTGSNAGHARVYNWNGSAWVQKGADFDAEAANDQYGKSVSLSSDGNTMAIGAPLNDGNGSNAGHARIYSWNGSVWVQKGTDIDGEAIDDNFGCSVCLSSDGNTVAIGGYANDGNGSNSGHVKIYTWNGSAWVQKGTNINGEAVDDYSGISNSLSSDGNTIAIGAFRNDGGAADGGHARVYSWNGSAWVQKGIDLDAEGAGDYYGISVSLSDNGNTIVIGGHYNDGNGSDAGHARVFSWSGTAWVQKGTDIDGEAAFDCSGLSVNLSSDGNTVAIGGYNNDGIGFNAGHTRIYSWNGSAWAQKGIDIDGEAANDNAGRSVFLSDDGNTIVIGAYANSGNGVASGHARVYKYADIIPPVAVCQDITVYLDGAGNTSITDTNIDGGSTDNVGILSYAASQTLFTCTDIGTNIIDLVVTDFYGNSDNCQATVTVQDTVPPTAICKNITVYLNGSGMAIVFPADVNGGSYDNCSIAGMSSSPAVFTCANLGANTVTLTATDGSGNTGQCNATVTVMDSISPTAVCQNITVYLDGSGNASITAADID
ncbi:MAG: hypothetical protein JXR53_06595, partial [Bacteroidales bacterium]|nr:hypothetical protein [Bacteroidales bacterium]